MSTNTDLSVNEMTDEQLEAFLAKRKESKAKEARKARKEYEHKRDITIDSLVTEAVQIHIALKEFKERCHSVMDAQHEVLTNYGGIRGNSKGGFSIVNSNGNLRVRRTRATEPYWDERSDKAVELIKQFLEGTVKKRDLDTYEILMTFISRNKKNDLEYAKVFSLLQHKNRYNDPRWVSGLELIQESFSVHLRGYGYVFEKRGDDQKWEAINMSFTNL